MVDVPQLKRARTCPRDFEELDEAMELLLIRVSLVERIE
jgi:hypothetical protein